MNFLFTPYSNGKGEASGGWAIQFINRVVCEAAGEPARFKKGKPFLNRWAVTVQGW